MGEPRPRDYVSPARADELRPLLSPANRLALDVCRATGYRISDVVSLERAAVEAARDNNGWLEVTEQKTGKVRLYISTAYSLR